MSLGDGAGFWQSGPLRYPDLFGPAAFERREGRSRLEHKAWQKRLTEI